MEIYSEIENELNRILSYWVHYSVDHVHGGFCGRRNQENELVPESPKGSVLNCRILWTFAAAYKFSRQQEHLDLAKRAYEYIKHHFIDNKYGGVYWTVDYKGQPLETKKQTYALSFAIYGLTEYYSVSGDSEALHLAIEIFLSIEGHCRDNKKQGYFEAFQREWSPLDDMRLSEKDLNEAKTMNTHLHILEAYTNLFRYWKPDTLRERLEDLIHIFNEHIIDVDTHHLTLFMDEDWNSGHNIFSFGHDIEASWLLLEAATVLENKEIIEKIKKKAIQLLNSAKEGLLYDGSVIYERNLDKGIDLKEKHWWVQAEAMVGFYNGFQLTGNTTYYNDFERSWHFIKTNILDLKNGEWFWGVDENNKPMPEEDKLGIWKCPYHNTRACLEILNRKQGNNPNQ